VTFPGTPVAKLSGMWDGSGARNHIQLQVLFFFFYRIYFNGDFVYLFLLFQRKMK
jgi:hypothetical protein